jgi:hypothetical protein
MGVLPPDVSQRWNANSVAIQADMLGYEQIRGFEEEEERLTLYKMLGAKL